MIEPFSARLFIAQVATWHGVPVDDILSPKRDAPTFAARRDIAVHLKERNWSLPQIGKLLHRDHSSIHNALKEKK